MLRIGFSKKYYTLWEVSEKTEYVQLEGVRLPFKKKTAYFIKNLSFDERTAKRKSIFEGVENYDVDFSLCGAKHLLKQYLSKNIDDLFFLFCEYRSEVVKEILLQNGFVDYHGQIVYPEHGEKLKKGLSVLNEIRDRDEISVKILSNLNENNEFRFEVKNELFHGFLIGETKRLSYRQNEFFLPVVDGAAKRIKNKKAKLSVRKYMNDTFIINNIQIL